MDSKKKITLEYSVNSSIKLIYNRISTAAGLSEWFADDVNIEGETFVFFWGKTEQRANIISHKKEKSVKFKWIDDEDPETFFEFNIETQELSGSVLLIITDFVYFDEEIDAIDLWNKQIEKFKRAIGG
jgi:uncharacterized protein YndB with AHSA1/START domain